MKKKFDDNRDDALLDAVLGGEPWTELNQAVKDAAMAHYLAAQRRRRTVARFTQAAAILLLAGCVWWLHRPADSEVKPAATAPANQRVARSDTNAQIAVTPAVSPSPVSIGDDTSGDPKPRYISEAEMIALFPPGSCTVAEVNGQKQLIFFDSKIEREGADYNPGS